MASETTVAGALRDRDIDQFRTEFGGDPRNRLAMNAVTKTSLKAVAMNRAAVVRHNHTFSHVVKAGAATSQNGSGRCWMFAGLNTLRMAAADQMNMEDFELSQNYPMFWDKLEKANYFLESILETLEEPTSGRLISWLLQSPIQDGGQWDMFANLVEKYGVVPKEAMPETESSSSTGVMNDKITTRLREHAAELRRHAASGVKTEALRRHKHRMLDEIYRMLAIHLGEPPREFLWQWRDKDKVFHRDGVLTPQEFLAKHVTVDLDALICLIHCPQSTKQMDTVYTVNFLGNVVGGRPVRYLNVDLDVMKRAAIAQLKDGKPVWFGCDVGKEFDRELGLMDMDLFEIEPIYNVGFTADKAERLDYGHSQMTHAMVFTGVDLDDDDRPRKWRVENSWGEKVGEKGFMVMTDGWFDAYNYEVVVDRKYLNFELQRAAEAEPIGLPPWDPMGSLAAGA